MAEISQIGWKYKTPLKGKELAGNLSHSSTPGLCSIPSFSSGNSNLTVYDFSALIKPYATSYTGANDVLVKVKQTNTSGIIVSNLTTGTPQAVMLSCVAFDSSDTSNNKGDVNFTPDVYSYKSTNTEAIVIGVIYIEDDVRHVTANGAEWSDWLISEKGYNPLQWLAPQLPGRTESTGYVGVKTIEVRCHNNLSSNPVLINNTGDSSTNRTVVVASPTNTLTLSDYDSDTWLAIGYEKGSSVLSVLSTGSTRSDLSFPQEDTLIGLMLYIDNNVYKSEYYNTFSSGVSGTGISEYQSVPYSYVITNQTDFETMLADASPGTKYSSVFIKAGTINKRSSDSSVTTWNIETTGTSYICGNYLGTTLNEIKIVASDGYACFVENLSFTGTYDTMEEIRSAQNVLFTVDSSAIGISNKDTLPTIYYRNNVRTSYNSTNGLTTSQSATIGGTLNVTGVSNFSGNVNVTGDGAKVSVTNGYLEINKGTNSNSGIIQSDNLIQTTGTGSIKSNSTITAAGNITSSGGSITAGKSITASGSITSSAGNITASSGNISAGGTITANDNITSTNGNIIVQSGSVMLTVGNVNAGGSVIATTNVMSYGNITAKGLISCGKSVEINNFFFKADNPFYDSSSTQEPPHLITSSVIADNTVHAAKTVYYGKFNSYNQSTIILDGAEGTGTFLGGTSNGSSRKFKTSIKKSKLNATEYIDKIKIVDFKYKNNNKQPCIGFIAEDTDELVSSLQHDKMILGNCVGALLKAVQELSKRLDKLEKQNAKASKPSSKKQTAKKRQK